MELDREKAKSALNGIFGMTVWNTTPQGSKYWKSVYDEIQRLLNDTKIPGSRPQYREPNEGDIDKEIELRGDGEEKWRTGKLLAIDDGWFVCAVKFFEFTASVATRHARIAIEPAAPPEPDWITPTDEDAKRRPEVEVSSNGKSNWHKATLIFVDDTKSSMPFFTVMNHGGLYWANHCRMRKDAT